MNKEIIGSDVDGVVASFTIGFLRRARELGHHERLPLSREHWTEWYASDAEAFDIVWKHIIDDYEFWETLPLEPGVEELLHLIKTDFWVTARPVPSEVTARWMENVGVPAAEVITVPVDSNKVGVLRELGVTKFVDDKVSTFIACNEGGVHCNLMTTPTNRHVELPKEFEHLRIYSLKEYYL